MLPSWTDTAIRLNNIRLNIVLSSLFVCFKLSLLLFFVSLFVQNDICELLCHFLRLCSENITPAEGTNVLLQLNVSIQPFQSAALPFRLRHCDEIKCLGFFYNVTPVPT